METTAKTANAKMVTKLLFKLLPVQILLAAVGAVNGIVSSFFASNFVGTDAMSAVGLYSPLNMLVTSVGAILVGGSVILCGKYMEQLMVIPESFGAAESERMDMSVGSMEEVVRIAEQVQKFCLERGVDERRAYLSGLSMEEMAGNIVDHGFTKDNKRHSLDVRVVHKGDDVILRIKDDCVPFDPGERQKLAEGEDITKNIGIRMVFRIASEVKYQNILGMNVLTIRI
ncbi:MAG: ATP-binding protein [Clostridia bacterium]|nr:ATP-binding protein [Clostridia bacterium]MBQ3938620.1 ATP-binding protein [Clostridia bacterium]